MLQCPNIEDVPGAAGASPQHGGQAIGDNAEVQAQVNADAGISGVAAGCLVSPGTGMSVNIAAGFLCLNDLLYPSLALTGVAVAAASTTDRRDSVVVSQPITLGATSYASGGGAVTSIAVLALPYAIPSGATIAMANGDMVVLSSPASVGATTVSIVSQTPTAGAGWAASSVVTPAWVVSGTPNPAGGAGWTTSLAVLPPVKPTTPAGAALVAEVYVVGSGATATTSIAAGNIVDKTTPVRSVQKWSPAAEAWTRTAGSSGVASTFTITSNVNYTTKYVTGMKLRWSESGVVKYGYVASSAFSAGVTTVTTIASTSYWMAASPDAGSQFTCDSGTVPVDFVEWHNFTTTIVGCSSSTVVTAAFKIQGRTCYVSLEVFGTSNSTAKTATLPLGATGAFYGVAGYTKDNGTASATPAGVVVTGLFATTVIMYKDSSQANWTASGSWNCYCNFQYQI